MSSTLDNSKRHRVFMKTFYHCGYCGKILLEQSDLTIDHMVPQSIGGSNELNNLIGCCHSCNELKSDLSISQFKNKLNDSIKIANRFTKECLNENIVFFFEKYSEDYLKTLNTI